jgi:urease accessory protein
MNAVLLQHESSGWQADLRLVYRRAGPRTILAERAHSGPLLVQRPFHPEAGVCHSYVIHPPGGVVGGDRLRLSARVEQGAHALLTTPGATRCYRSGGGRRANLNQDLEVSAGTLEWLPQETIAFDGADFRSCTHVTLDQASKFIGWEILCLGRPESNAPFGAGRVQQDLRVTVGTTTVFLDRLRISAPGAYPLSSTWGLRGREAIGTMLAWPGNEEAVAAIRDVASPLVDCAFTMVDKVIVCRAAAAQGEAIRMHFVAVWQTLRRRILRRAAVAPRIWST